jgi:hypothetical protein
MTIRGAIYMGKLGDIQCRFLWRGSEGAEYLILSDVGGAKPVSLSKQGRRQGEAGSAFVLALIVMAIVAILGSVGVNTSRSDNRTVLVYRHGSESFYAGETGLQQGRRNLRARSFNDLVGLAGIMTQSGKFTWPSCYDDAANEWQRIDNPKVLYQPFVPADPVIGRSHSKLPGSSGNSTRTGAAVGGISNAVLETSRICLRAEGFSEKEAGRVESRIEEWIITYLPVQP